MGVKNIAVVSCPTKHLWDLEKLSVTVSSRWRSWDCWRSMRTRVVGSPRRDSENLTPWRCRRQLTMRRRLTSEELAQVRQRQHRPHRKSENCSHVSSPSFIALTY